jgi:hypothetical protein
MKKVTYLELKVRYNCVIKTRYDDRLRNCDTLLCNIKDKLRKLGIEYLFDCELSILQTICTK